jgi:hypothetical protein
MQGALKAGAGAILQDDVHASCRIAWARRSALDHDDFGLNQSKIINVIDSKSLERDWREKPVSTFSHPALVRT